MRWTEKLICVAALGTLGSVPAAAAEIGASSSGRVGVTVIIPPVVAALNARAGGAVGMWTVVDDKSALMIAVPDKIIESQSAVTVYRGKDVFFSASIAPNAFVVLTRESSVDFHGLTRDSFSIRRTGFATIKAPPQTINLVVSSI